MGQDPENNEKETKPLDLDDLRLMEAAVIKSILHDELEDEKAGEVVAKLALVRLSIEIENQLVNVEEEITEGHKSDDFNEHFIESELVVKKVQTTAHMIIEYFTLSSIFIETLSIRLLKEELIVDKYSETRKTENILEHRMGQETREDLLLRTGIIDDH